MKAALVTGCSEGGIGHAMALAFANAGYHTFATARSVSKMGSLSSASNMTLLPLDVTSLTSVKDAVQAVKASGHTLEVIVNNAGVAPVMPVLDTDFEDGGMAKNVFETNVWGGARLVQAFQHMIVESRGTIVNVTSINPFMVRED
jgi:1-acylglycerone phosphate reductase